MKINRSIVLSNLKGATRASSSVIVVKVICHFRNKNPTTTTTKWVHSRGMWNGMGKPNQDKLLSPHQSHCSCAHMSICTFYVTKWFA